jgi:hypothetical protein
MFHLFVDVYLSELSPHLTQADPAGVSMFIDRIPANSVQFKHDEVRCPRFDWPQAALTFALHLFLVTDSHLSAAVWHSICDIS